MNYFDENFQKEPIKLPKEPVVVSPVVQPEPEPQVHVEIPPPIVQQQQQQPDVIPLQRESVPPPEIVEALPPPAAFENAPDDLPVKSFESNGAPTAIPAPVVEEQIYSNINYEQAADTSHAAAGQTQATEEEQLAYVTALVGNEQHDLTEYIEDTGLKAIALYDYEATADDEISFDPNEIITHIEQIGNFSPFMWIPIYPTRLINCFIPLLLARVVLQMKDGGADYAETAMVSSRPITCNCRSKSNCEWSHVTLEKIDSVTHYSFEM